MTSTRSSPRNHSSGQKEETTSGTKRKADISSPKRSRKAAKQTTIEESFSGDISQDSVEDAEKNEEPIGGEEHEDNPSKPRNDGKADTKAEAIDDKAVQTSSQREKKMASNILEKGVIYFFTRNRVGIEDSDSVGDLQRTYFVLRPLPIFAKLGDGPLPDLENNRLLALPKKVFPRTHKDRFMAFVEKAKTTIQELKDNFFKSEEYETKSTGTRQTEPVVTVAEGVYAITRTEDRSTHLAYAITIPSNLGEVQEDLGIQSQGSFIISVKNPERPGPASTRLPQTPDYPQEIIEEFRGLAWSAVQPKHLDYANTQILLIGDNIESAVESTTKDKKHHKETPQDELEQLEHEDELRIEHLHGNDSIFDDLKISKNGYPKVPTTW